MAKAFGRHQRERIEALFQEGVGGNRGSVNQRIEGRPVGAAQSEHLVQRARQRNRGIVRRARHLGGHNPACVAVDGDDIRECPAAVDAYPQVRHRVNHRDTEGREKHGVF